MGQATSPRCHCPTFDVLVAILRLLDGFHHPLAPFCKASHTRVVIALFPQEAPSHSGDQIC